MNYPSYKKPFLFGVVLALAGLIFAYLVVTPVGFWLVLALTIVL